MSPQCPHYSMGSCPRTCCNTMFCNCAWYERASGMETFEAADVDFSAARPETCHSCRFFLKYAPRIARVK